MIRYNLHFIWLHSSTYVANGLWIKIDINYKNQIDNQDGVSSAVAHNEIDWEGAISNNNNLIDTTKPFQE